MVDGEEGPTDRLMEVLRFKNREEFERSRCERQAEYDRVMGKGPKYWPGDV